MNPEESKANFSIIEAIAKHFKSLSPSLFGGVPSARPTARKSTRQMGAYRAHRKIKNKMARKSRRVNRMREA